MDCLGQGKWFFYTEIGEVNVKLFFFTIADENRRDEAKEILIASGKHFGREIHLFDIPKGWIWDQYKRKLLADPGLAKADKYIYLDSDTVMTKHGDWESEQCQGVMDVFYFCPEQRKKHTMGFLRTLKTFEYVYDLWTKFDYPIWCNSGVVVLKADVRINFMRCWIKWQETIDKYCENNFWCGEEASLMFARHFFGLPLLPPQFNGICKSQPIYDWHVLLHAAANPSKEKKLPYTNAIKRILGK